MRLEGVDMLRYAMKVLIVIFTCAILVVGSFVEDNFGLTQTLTEPIFNYPTSHWRSPWYLERRPTIVLILTILLALVLVRSHRMPSTRKRVPTTTTDEMPYPAWKVPFRKYKYRNSGAILPKRHPKYYSQRA